jgi:hypothetical protein
MDEEMDLWGFTPIARETKTFLLDEIDNTAVKGSLLSILNEGFSKKGTIPRVVEGKTVEFPIFAPVAFAGIGRLPNQAAALVTRCISMVIHPALEGEAHRLDLMNETLMEAFRELNDGIIEWARGVNLNTDPEMPKGFYGRRADVWRVLFSIADSLDRGDVAREAAMHYEANRQHVNECALFDVEKVFDKLGAKGIWTEMLVEEMLNLDDPDYDWTLYKGVQQLTKGALSRILHGEFEIEPQPVWWPEGVHRSQQVSKKGFYRKALEEMWKRYRR